MFDQCLSTWQIGAVTGIKQDRVTVIMLGEGPMARTEIAKLCEVLNVDIEEVEAVNS